MLFETFDTLNIVHLLWSIVQFCQWALKEWKATGWTVPDITEPHSDPRKLLEGCTSKVKNGVTGKSHFGGIHFCPIWSLK